MLPSRKNRLPRLLMTMTKQELRRRIREEKERLGEARLLRMSAETARRLLVHPIIKATDTILIYHSLPDEVSTAGIIQCLKRDGKTVILPRVAGHDRLTLHVYTGETSLTAGAYGIMEPVGAPFTDYESIAVAVVPGIAFDAHGNRLGRGHGYYDRLLPRLTHAYKIGLCFPFQLVGDVPVDPTDIPMNEIVT